MNSYDLIRKGLLPFMGGLQKFVPLLLMDVEKVVPRSDWRDWRFHDITCGSCSGGAVFNVYGMSVTMNDLALRSYLAARAIFGPVRSKRSTLLALLEGPPTIPQGRKPAYELANGFLHPKACVLFDRLYWAAERGALTYNEGAYYKFLAIRWVLLNKGYMYFVKLPTEDLEQLALQGPAWAKLCHMLGNPFPALYETAKSIDHLSHAISSAGARDPAMIFMGDCRQVVTQLPFDRPSFVSLNPPTIGDKTFKLSNRLLDALIYSEKQPIEDDALPADLWKSLIRDTAKHVPPGHFIFNYVGDGALSWDEGHAVHKELGEIVSTYTFERKPGQTAGVVLIRRS